VILLSSQSGRKTTPRTIIFPLHLLCNPLYYRNLNPFPHLLNFDKWIPTILLSLDRKESSAFLPDLKQLPLRNRRPGIQEPPVEGKLAKGRAKLFSLRLTLLKKTYSLQMPTQRKNARPQCPRTSQQPVESLDLLEEPLSRSVL
jgi:hypothetical protein